MHEVEEYYNGIFSLESNLNWLERLPTYIKEVYFGELLDNGVFNEIHNDYRRSFFKRKLIRSEYVGVWGWNTWCGIHTFPLMLDKIASKVYKRTVDVGFTRTEPETNLLPHAILHKNGKFGSNPTYKCYGGKHGEAYNLGNILGWAKMAMEYALISNDLEWFNQSKLDIISDTINYMLDNLRGKFNPYLIYTGIEGDWTECTEWELDNGNVNANMLKTLELYTECQKLLGNENASQDYIKTREQMFSEFNKPVEDGGFWSDRLGHYIHGNNGDGTEVYGDTYFESTVNYFALLWDLVPNECQELLWSYLTAYGDKIEFPYPVLTNFRPREGARRTNYGKTVTNGDVWLVLGAHATAARLKSGFINRGTRMYKTIIDYEIEHGVFHNSLYQDGSVNDSWDPEVANNGAPFPPLIYGVLGMKPSFRGIEFNIGGLIGLDKLKMKVFLFGIAHELRIKFANAIPVEIELERLDNKNQDNKIYYIDSSRFICLRTLPHEVVELPD